MITIKNDRISRVPGCECNIDKDEACEECCDHSDIEYDEGCCLICGKDLTEELSARAYDRWKDYNKYGE